MALRITGGTARGRLVRGVVAPGVRPTTERVREALFSMIGQDLGGQTVLDAFGGAGMVGLECWSRGATVTLVERDRRALAALHSTARELDVQWTVLAGDVLRRARTLPVFDGIFIDPPYAMDPAPVVAALGPLARRWVAVEVASGRHAPSQAGALPLDRERAYGRTALWVFRA